MKSISLEFSYARKYERMVTDSLLFTFFTFMNQLIYGGVHPHVVIGSNSPRNYDNLWGQILSKHYAQNLPSLRYFVALHANDTGLLKQLATEDPDPRVRKTAVEKIFENSLLTSIAIEDRDRSVQIAAINQITDKKSLLMLRLSLRSELQGLVNERARRLEYKIF